MNFDEFDLSAEAEQEIQRIEERLRDLDREESRLLSRIETIVQVEDS